MVYTVIDFEATSTSPYTADPICFSYITFRDSLIDVIEANTFVLYQDNYVWSEEAQAVHGLTEEFCKGFKDNYHDYIREIYRVCFKSYLVGQNIKTYDQPLLEHTLNKLGYMPLEIQRTFDIMWSMGGKKSLTRMREELGLDDEYLSMFSEDIFPHTVFGGGTKAHNSEADVIATALIFTKAMTQGYNFK